MITGFEAAEIIEGILMIVRQIAQKRAAVEIQYRTVVREEGNPRAVALLEKYFEPAEAYWRGIGAIPGSGLKLREQYAAFDAYIEVQASAFGRRGAGAVLLRRYPARREDPDRMRALRHGMYAGKPGRSLHGEHRGQLRGVL